MTRTAFDFVTACFLALGAWKAIELYETRAQWWPWRRPRG